MRRSLFAAASILALSVTPALAQEVTVDDTRDEPVDTATVDNGAPANLVIGANGRVQLTNVSGPAVTVNSDNDLTINPGARIEIFDTDANGDDVDLNGAIGVQIEDGVDADLTHGGAISLGDTYFAEPNEGTVVIDGEEFDDPEADGPFALDANKTGLLIGEVDANYAPVTGQTGVTGSVTMQSSSVVQVAGQDSFGVRTVTDLSGDLIAGGRIAVRGERSRALSVEGDIGGDIEINRVDLTSPEGVGVAIEGDVAGGMRILGSVSVSGYRISQRLTQVLIEQFESEDLQNSGSAIVIAGNLVDGVFFGIGADVNHNSGAGAGVSIGRGGDTIALGAVALPDDFLAASGEEDDDDARDQLDHAVVNQGAISANGVYDGRTATAFLIGGRDELGQLRAVILGGDGLRNEGLIEASAFDATATAVRFGEGAQAETISNTGQIIARSLLGYDGDGLGDADDPATSDVVEGYTVGAAVALHLDEGSSIRRLLNEQGDIFAFVQRGSSGQSRATAVLIETESLEEFETSGVLSANLIGIAPDGLDDDRGGERIAIDASSRTTGLTVRQVQALDADGDPTAVQPEIIGDILFGSGDDTLDLQAGLVTGDIAFGAGADRLILNGAEIVGAISDSDANLTIDVSNGRIVLQGEESLNLTDAFFRDGGELQIVVSTTDRTGAFVSASGQVSFASGSALSIGLENLVGEGGEFSVISASQLDISDDVELAASSAPFLYDAVLRRDATDQNTLVLTLRRKTAQELGMNPSQAAAFNEALAAFTAVESLNSVFAGLRTSEEFFSGYDQLLPEYAASAIQFALANNDAASGALAARLRNARLAPDELAGVWVQEFGYFADRAGSAFGDGYRGQGVGLALGLDRPMGPFYAVGLSLVGSASEIEETNGFDEPLVALSGQLGGYLAADLGGFDVSGSLGIGFDRFESERQLLIGDFSSVNTADWSGWHIAASAVAGRDFTAGSWVIRPEASLTYLTLFESGYEETAEDPANDRLALIVDDRESTSFSAAATLNIARRFGDDRSWWAPHLRAGYRAEFDDAMAETIAQFGADGSPFALRSASIPGSGYLLGLGLSAGSDYSTFTFAYDADVRDGFVRHVGRLVIRLTF